MRDKELKDYLKESLGKEKQPQKLEETILLCTKMMEKQKLRQKEERTGFWRYLSDIFRLEGAVVLGVQAVMLFFACMLVFTISGEPEYLPVFMPLFVLAVIPVLFRSRFYGMEEIEAVTRASGAQIILAKLILSGAVNIICITIFFCFEIYLRKPQEGVGRMVLYCLVPYLVCMSAMLRIARIGKKEGVWACVSVMLGFCVLWGISSKTLPWLYETSAAGLWLLMFLLFAGFFLKEFYYIVNTRKAGKMYGIIS